MNVLLLGATGQLGSRILPALVAHSHQTTVIVRNRKKLASSIPAACCDRVSIIDGDARDQNLLAQVMRAKNVNCVVNAAGHAPIFSSPETKTQLVDIVKASLDAVEDIGNSADRTIRTWFLGGMLLLDLPGSTGRKLLGEYLPVYKDHEEIMPLLGQAKRANWSLLCPAAMSPISKSILSPENHLELQRKRTALTANPDEPPDWHRSSFRSIPLIGTYMEIFGNVMKYNLAFEDVAEFIAKDLADGASDGGLSRRRVGLKAVQSTGGSYENKRNSIGLEKASQGAKPRP